MRIVTTKAVMGICLGAGLLSACAAPGPVNAPVDSAPVDVLSPEERRLQAVESKLALVQRRLDSLNILRFDDEIGRMRDDLRGLRGDVEKSRYDLQLQDRRGKDLYQDLDRRLQALEGRSAAPAMNSPATGNYGAPAYAAPAQPAYSAPQAYTAPVVPVQPAPAPSAPVSAASDGGSPEEEGAYLASFDLLKSGKFDDAVRGFRSVLDKWPRGRYADNAAYWMGEASYVKRDYPAALSAFQMVVNSFPASSKAPDAMLKAGLTQLELKQTDAGQATLQQVVRKYPNSSAAKSAQQKLSSLGGAAGANPAGDSDRPRR